MTAKQKSIWNAARHCLVVLAFATVLFPGAHIAFGWLPPTVDEDGEPIEPFVGAVLVSPIASGVAYWAVIARLRKDEKKISDLRTAIQVAACDQRVNWRSVPYLNTYCPTRNLPLAITLETIGVLRSEERLDEIGEAISRIWASIGVNQADHIKAALDAVEVTPYYVLHLSFQIVSGAFREIIDRETRERFPRDCYFAELNILTLYRASHFQKIAFAEMAAEVKNPCFAALIRAIAPRVDGPARREETCESVRREINAAFLKTIELEGSQ